jgi:molecular chaperone DnaJ
MRDYYEILEVSKKATDIEIKSAYKRLAKKYHPDVNKAPDAQDKFKEISKAYQVLSDPNKRTAYDQYGHAAFEQAQQNGYNPNQGGFDPSGINFEDLFGGFSGGGGFRDPFDMFNDFFGGRGSSSNQRQERRGEDLALRVEITFEEAYFGVEKSVTYEHQATCAQCSGTGSENKNQPPDTCPQCQGRGQVRYQQSFMGANFSQVTVCPKCHGEGKIITNPCHKCKGAGRVKAREELTIKVPKGIDSGMQIRYREKGNAGRLKQASGDLYVTFRVKPHQYFSRRDTEIHLEVPISPVQAILGDTLEVPTMTGKQTINLPAGTSNGAQFELKNLGFPHVDSKKQGSEIITVKIKVPQKLAKEEKELYEKIKQIENKPPSFLNKIFS